MTTGDYLTSMAVCGLFTIAVETATLLALLSNRHSVGVRVFAGVWLTACTYPIVWLVLPFLIPDRGWYLLAAETFAPVAEAALFWFAFARGLPRDVTADRRDAIAIVVANLLSFGLGEGLRGLGATFLN